MNLESDVTDKEDGDYGTCSPMNQLAQERARSLSGVP
jgi:hypothetical protein